LENIAERENLGDRGINEMVLKWLLKAVSDDMNCIDVSLELYRYRIYILIITRFGFSSIHPANGATAQIGPWPPL
jgi:hypothetical protein